MRGVESVPGVRPSPDKITKFRFWRRIQLYNCFTTRISPHLFTIQQTTMYKMQNWDFLIDFVSKLYNNKN